LGKYYERQQINIVESTIPTCDWFKPLKTQVAEQVLEHTIDCSELLRKIDRNLEELGEGTKSMQKSVHKNSTRKLRDLEKIQFIHVSFFSGIGFFSTQK